MGGLFATVDKDEANAVFSQMMISAKYGRASIANELSDMEVGETRKIDCANQRQAQLIRNAVAYASKIFRWGYLPSSTRELPRRAGLSKIVRHPDGTATLYVSRLKGVATPGDMTEAEAEALAVPGDEKERGEAEKPKRKPRKKA